jgi:hypothetical protein
MKNTAHPVMLFTFLKFIKVGFIPLLEGWAKIGIFSTQLAVNSPQLAVFRIRREILKNN